MGTIRAGRAPLLTSAQVSERPRGRVLTNQEARTIASQWASRVGFAMAGLADTGAADSAALLADITSTMVDVSMHRNEPCYRDLCDLYAWSVLQDASGDGAWGRAVLDYHLNSVR